MWQQTSAIHTNMHTLTSVNRTEGARGEKANNRKKRLNERRKKVRKSVRDFKSFIHRSVWHGVVSESQPKRDRKCGM